MDTDACSRWARMHADRPAACMPWTAPLACASLPATLRQIPCSLRQSSASPGAGRSSPATAAASAPPSPPCWQRDGVEVIGLDLPDFDLADTATLEARLAALVAERGPIDILVNNAGVTVLGSVLETSLAEVERVFRVNFLAAYALMRAVLPGMAERRRGAIVNIASDQALIGKQVSAAYGASKAAIAQLSRSAALDWARFGIRVNCIAPGSTDTPMLAAVIGDLAAKYPDRFPTSSADAYRVRRAAGALRAAGGDRRGGGVPGVRRGVVHHRRGPAGRWRHHRGMSGRHRRGDRRHARHRPRRSPTGWQRTAFA